VNPLAVEADGVNECIFYDKTTIDPKHDEITGQLNSYSNYPLCKVTPTTSVV
jgi:hypothetical protein